MKYTHILWDWNGTLLDDVEISIDCVNIMLEKLGLQKTNLSEYYQMMDFPMHRYYENLFNKRGSQLEYKLCTKNFQENYPKLIDKASLSDGATQILNFIKNQGAKQYIVSSFEKTKLCQYVEKFNVKNYFEIISGDDSINVESKSQRAIDIVKNVDKSKVLYIGDTKADYITACDIGCDCVLYSGGHQPREVLEKFNQPVIDNLTQLKEYI